MRGTRLWLITGLVALFAAMMVVAGCGDDSDDSSSDSGSSSGTIDVSDADLLEEGQLLVGTDAPYPPFEIGTPEEGNFSGFDPDLMDAIAEKLGLEPTYQNSSFDTIFRDVAAGQFDIVAAASTITPGSFEDGDVLAPLLRGPAGARGRGGLGHRHDGRPLR